MRCRFKSLPHGASTQPGLTCFLALIVLWSARAAIADDDPLAVSRRLLNAVQRLDRPAWLQGPSDAARRQAQAVLDAAQLPSTAAPQNAPSLDQPRTFVLYASLSLGEAGLRALLEESAGRPDVLVVFRGVRPDQRLGDFMRELHALIRSFPADRAPQVVIDPTRFRAAGVTVVPTLTLEENGRILAKVSGVTGIDWFRARLQRGGDFASIPQELGQQGPTREIAEVDLIEELQRRVTQIDWAAKRREALAHFWERQRFEELPEARVRSEKVLDLTVTAPREVRAPDGTLIVPAGQRIDPLERLPFTQRLVIFDATHPAQVEQAHRLGREAGTRRVTYLATRLDRAAGWKGLAALEQTLGAPVYLLPAEVRQRFGLERVPAVVEARDGQIVRREGPVLAEPPAASFGGALLRWGWHQLARWLPAAQAAEVTSSKALDPLCPDAELWSGKLITDLCWACLFPIRIAGGTMGSGDYPSAATDRVFCICNDVNGVPDVGMTLGLWSPARLIELVPSPWCSPALGGLTLGSSLLRLRGTTGQAEYDNGEIAFFNYHYFAFPLYVMLDLFWDNRCNADGYRDFDLLYLSELDPTWNNDELAFFTNPEVALFANPVAISACVADAAAATAGHPLDAMFWCAGTWGSMYPFAGLANPTVGADPKLTSLFAVRATAALHRRGLAVKTVGNDALCGGQIAPFIPKSQYSLTMFYPVADTDRRHAIGESPLRWGLGHTYPGPGDSHVHLLWRWADCCSSGS